MSVSALIALVTSELQSVPEETTEGISPVFIGIVAVIAVCMIIFIIQNFVLKKEENYK